MDDLDKDRSIDTICLHELEQHFDRGILGRGRRALREGEGGIMFPDVYVRVDQKGLFAGNGRGKRCGKSTGQRTDYGCGEKMSAVHHDDRSSLSIRTTTSRDAFCWIAHRR